jgi:hypothetical protein
MVNDHLVTCFRYRDLKELLTGAGRLSRSVQRQAT